MGGHPNPNPNPPPNPNPNPNPNPKSRRSGSPALDYGRVDGRPLPDSSLGLGL